MTSAANHHMREAVEAIQRSLAAGRITQHEAELLLSHLVAASAAGTIASAVGELLGDEELGRLLNPAA